MKTTIFYFTSTGNSLKIARDLAGSLDGQTELVFIPDVIRQDRIKTDAQRVGIVYPVYMLGEPLIVSEFIGKLALKSSAYIFSVANYAGMMGSGMYQTKLELQRAGLKLSAGFGFKMPNNYTPLGEALPTEEQEKVFSEEREMIKEIAQAVKDRKQILPKTFPLTVFLGRLVYKFCAPKVPSCDKDLWVTEECTSCGICAKVCPVDNIIIEDGRPRWLGKCQSCVACLQWCPAEAIQYGKSTMGKKRYHHPEVALEDIIRKDKK